MNLPPSPLVTTEWLAAHLSSQRASQEASNDLRIVDIRGKVLPAGTVGKRYFAKREDYDAAHIPGAVFVDWTSDIVDPDDAVPSQIASPDRFAALMLALGIGDDTAVVAYDDYNTIFASRFAWALRYYGHDAVRVLDGGFARWTSEKRAVDDGVPHPPPALFTPRSQAKLRRVAEQVLAKLGDPEVLLIDARPPAQYVGTASAAKRAGHIPGARNVPYTSLVDQETGKLLARDELAKVLASAGIDVAKLPREIVCYCNGGITATVPVTALRLFGRDDVAVYDGSWNEWGNDDARPIVSGEKP
jgi:thiosulfate/3-mercaptopyruvate sulfurtransferase